MNLSKLFDMQRELDAKIVKEKGLEDMDRLPYLILALQVELGECANEWRGFKYWSKDREPRTKEMSIIDLSKRFNTETGENIEWKNPLLEEYVDCLHFILSIGLLLEMNIVQVEPIQWRDITRSFLWLMSAEWGDWGFYTEAVEVFIGLGEMLGFTWEQIEQAYMSKNAVNHERQANGY